MQLDPDLVRAILLDLEKDPAQIMQPNQTRFLAFRYDGQEAATVSEHVRLLGEAGLIETYQKPTPEGVLWCATRMTWEGHQYLSQIKSESVYEKSKEIAASAFKVVTLETIKAALPHALRIVLARAGFTS
jgi:hypothetical protein